VDQIEDFDQRRDLKEFYRVWFAYLLQTPTFIEFIKQHLHKEVLLDDLGPEVKIIEGYFFNWIEPLLPDLWHRFPRIDDFDRLWSYWRFFPHFTGDQALVDTRVIPDLVGDIKKHFPAVLDEMMCGKISRKDVVDWLTFRVERSGGEGNLIFKVSDPQYFPKKDIIRQIENHLSDYPELKFAKPGEIYSGDEPVRFASPSWVASGDIKPGSLAAMKKYLTWYVLSNEPSGDFSLKNVFESPWLFAGKLPFRSDGFNLTNHKYEIDLADRTLRGFLNQDDLQEKLQQKKYKYHLPKVALQRKEKAALSSFERWAKEQSRSAEEIISAVKLGWFPRVPKSY